MTKTYDVAVIGGGPAGMMAAGRAAELGASVVLLEKNPSLGKKLLITGGGRCNVFNAEYDVHRLAEKYGKKGKALFSVFSQFDAEASKEFFESRGLQIKVEAEQRAFPITDKAEDVHKTMVAYMKEHGVEVRLNAGVTGIDSADGKIVGLKLKNGRIEAKNYILATGGKSRPETGSTGEGFSWMKELGHTVIEPDPALVPVTLKDDWTKKLSGIALRGVKLTATQYGKKKEENIGKMLFTHVGISGPLVLNMSKRIGELLKEDDVTLLVDLFPKLDHGAVDVMLLKSFEGTKNRMIKNAIGDIVQPRLGHAILELAKIDGDTTLNQLSRDDRVAFGALLKALPLRASGLLGEDKAIVTGGGVDLKEIEFKSMRSKRYANLFLAGDVLDFDRPSGGFSLQICWTTGFVAGTNAAK
jgi:predicted Rossmann fold flavoprotein